MRNHKEYSKLAKFMADKIGHGMSEKCERSAEIADEYYQEEIKELKAQIDGYQEIVSELIGGAEDIEPFDVVIGRGDYDMLVEHDNKTTQQCLADVRADAVEEFVNRICGSSGGEFELKLRKNFNHYARKLRDNAK